MKPTMTLFVKERTSSGADRFGNESFTYSEPISVPGCLFAPFQPKDLEISRPEGVEVTATAYFPRGWAKRLRRAQVSPDGERWFNVVGAPVDFPEQMIPKGWKWSCLVPLGVVDG